MTKTEELLESLTQEINELSIAWYIKEEAISSLKYLHRYKLKNIEKNLNSFREYLVFLNTQNTEKINKLCPQKTKNLQKISFQIYIIFSHLRKNSLNKLKNQRFKKSAIISMNCWR